MQIYIYALVAIALSDNGNLQTIRYHSTYNDCIAHLEKVKPTVDKDLIKLDCIPVKVKEQ